MRAAATNLNLPWSSENQIEAANEIDRLREENWTFAKLFRHSATIQKSNFTGVIQGRRIELIMDTADEAQELFGALVELRLPNARASSAGPPALRGSTSEAGAGSPTASPGSPAPQQ